MTFSELIILLSAIALFLAYALWDLGAEHLVASVGCFIIRVLTLGRVRLPPEQIDSTGAILAGAVTVIFFFFAFLGVTAYLV